ncbi:hypothetical protein JCM12141A_57700 [Mycolicibacterium hodleri]
MAFRFNGRRLGRCTRGLSKIETACARPRRRDHSLDDNTDDSSACNHAHYTVFHKLNSLFTAPARSWPAEGRPTTSYRDATGVWH